MVYIRYLCQTREPPPFFLFFVAHGSQENKILVVINFSFSVTTKLKRYILRNYTPINCYRSIIFIVSTCTLKYFRDSYRLQFEYFDLFETLSLTCLVYYDMRSLVKCCERTIHLASTKTLFKFKY